MQEIVREMRPLKEERVRVREIPTPAGHYPSNEPEDANQSHDAVLQIVLLRLTATIPFPTST